MDTKNIKLSEVYKVNQSNYIEEFLPKVLADRSVIMVCCNKGECLGYITEKELANSLSKTGSNELSKVIK